MGEMELLTTGENTSILEELMNCLKNHDIKKFSDLLKSENNLDLDHFFEDPHYGTLLDISCMEPNCSLFVELILNHGANPNIVNRIRKKAPIHFAVQNEDLFTMRKLLDCGRTDVNILDSTGSTALHYAVKSTNTKILEMLLQNVKIDLNVVNKKGKSPILVALEDRPPKKESIVYLLSHGTLKIEADPKSTIIKQKLNDLIPDWESKYEFDKESEDLDISVSHAFSLLRNNKIDKFIDIIYVKDDVAFFENDDGSHTFLQYCCEFGISKVVSVLLSIGVNPNKTSKTVIKTPIMIASYKGFVEIVRLLVECGRCDFSPVESETVLHSVVKGSSDWEGLCSGSEDCLRDHQACLSLLLTAPSRASAFINQGDYKGNTPLHYAGKQSDLDMVTLLLQSGASLSCFNHLNEPAFADINYATLKNYLDSCIYTNDKLPREESYEIILNYSCLKPVSYNNKNSNTKDIVEAGITNNDNRNTFESKALLYMTQNSELKYLLKHPIFRSFLHLKWTKIYKGFFANLIYYAIFLILMTTYILKIYPDVRRGSEFSFFNNTYRTLLILLLVVLVFRELAQLIISPLKYLSSLENFLEIGIIYTCSVILFSGRETPFDEKVTLSVVCIMLSWGELVLLIGRHPALSTYIEMLKTVSCNFLKFLAWYSALIIAFSLSFHILFGMDDCRSANSKGICEIKTNETDDENFFRSPQVSLFKTVIMLTGEFDAASVPFVAHPGLSHALFIAFLFFIAIVLFNLLNGLAVSDTQAIQSDSELVGYISRVKLISYVETLITNPLPDKNSIFNSNLFSCWETNFFTFLKNKMISKYINLFRDGYFSTDCEIRILPFYGNQVRLGGSKYATANRKDSEDKRCFGRCVFMEMDSGIIQAVKEVLMEKHLEQERKKLEQKKEEHEQKFYDMIRECNESIKQIRYALSENKETLEKLVKIMDR